MYIPWVKVLKIIKQDNKRTFGLSLCKNNENKQVDFSFKSCSLLLAKSSSSLSATSCEVCASLFSGFLSYDLYNSSPIRRNVDDKLTFFKKK